MSDPERLKHAPQPVIEVQAQQQHREDVERRYRNHLKAGHHVAVHVARLIMRIHVAEREIEQMINHERQDDGPAPVHGSRRVGRSGGLLHPVSHRPRVNIARRQLYRRPDVQQHHREQHDPHAPQQRGHGTQQHGVAIQLSGAFIDLKIADQMPDDEQKQNAPAHRHRGFLADG